MIGLTVIDVTVAAVTAVAAAATTTATAAATAATARSYGVTETVIRGFHGQLKSTELDLK